MAFLRKADGKSEIKRKSVWLEGRQGGIQSTGRGRRGPIQQRELSSFDFPRSSEKPRSVLNMEMMVCVFRKFR